MGENHNSEMNVGSYSSAYKINDNHCRGLRYIQDNSQAFAFYACTEGTAPSADFPLTPFPLCNLPLSLPDSSFFYSTELDLDALEDEVSVGEPTDSPVCASTSPTSRLTVRNQLSVLRMEDDDVFSVYVLLCCG